MMKKLALLTLDEALRQADVACPSFGSPKLGTTVTRRPPAPSLARLPSRTREFVLPPQLLPGPFSIYVAQ